MTLPLAALVILAASSPRPSLELGALQNLAAIVAHDAASSRSEAPVALHVRSESPELSEAFSTVLCAELSKKRLPCLALEKIPVRDAEPIARERGARSLLRLSLNIEHGLMHARGDLLGTWVNFWSGQTPTRPSSPAAAIERSVDADAFALALLSAPLQNVPPQVLSADEVQLSATPFARVGAWTSAVAAGDLDGDRRAEVIAMTDDELFVFSFEGKLLARRDMKALPLSLTPTREPYGFVSVLPRPARIRYQSARHARGETLVLDKGALKVVPTARELELLHAGQTVVTAQPQGGITAANISATFAGEAPTLIAGGPFTTVSTFALPTAGAYVLAVNPDGAAVLTNGTLNDVRLLGLASASALVDLDGDGSPELLSTLNEFNPPQDELRVFALPQSSSAEPLQHSARLPVSRGRVLQLAAADVDGDGPQEVIAASWLPDGTTELQLVRRVSR